MPTEIKGLVEYQVALKRFVPDLSVQSKIEIATALKVVVARAKGFVPSNGQVLSGWTKEGSSDGVNYRPFPKFDSVKAKAGITYSTVPSKENNNGFTALARIINKSAGGAIYETAGRKNLDGQPPFKRMKLVYRTSGADYPGADFQLNYHEGNAIGSKNFNNSLNPNAGKQFIDNLNSTGRLVNARPKGLVGRPSKKQTGRLIFRAWAEDNGKALAAVNKAIDKSTAMFYANTKKAA